jgi:transposase-like protein
LESNSIRMLNIAGHNNDQNCLSLCDRMCYITHMSRYISSVNNYHDLKEVWEKIKEKAPFDVVFFEVRCKYCDSREISKYGRYKSIQRWWCKCCKRKFTDNRAPPGMKTPSSMMKSAVSMYYKGVPIITIRKQLKDDYNFYPSESIVHKWIYRDTVNTLAHTKDHCPKVGNIWRVFESSITIESDKVWILDIVDLKTHFLLASRFSANQNIEDIRMLLESAREKAQKPPEEIIAKRKYFKGIEFVFGPGVRLVNTKNRQDKMHFAEYWNFVIRVRRKILSRQKLLKFAQLTLNGWIFYQNYVVAQKSLKDKTSSQEADIDYKHKTGLAFEEYRL